MHAALPFTAITLLTLTACATPLERCLNNASRETRRLQSAITTADANIARGYAIHRHTESYLIPKTCHDKRGRPYRCPQTRYRTIETPVAIDVTAEARKRDALAQNLATARSNAARLTDHCIALHPDE